VLLEPAPRIAEHLLVGIGPAALLVLLTPELTIEILRVVAEGDERSREQGDWPALSPRASGVDGSGSHRNVLGRLKARDEQTSARAVRMPCRVVGWSFERINHVRSDELSVTEDDRRRSPPRLESPVTELGVSVGRKECDSRHPTVWSAETHPRPTLQVVSVDLLIPHNHSESFL